MLGAANREKRMQCEILYVANPRPVAMYRAPPKTKLDVRECDEIRVAKTWNAGENDRSCFPNCSSAFFVPPSMRSGRKLNHKIGNQHVRLTLEERWKEVDHEHQKDGNDTSCDPTEGQSKKVAAILRLAINIGVAVEG
jgi:hypothetical protein